MLNKTLIMFLVIVIVASPALALENLDELEVRTSRKSTNTFYSGEDSGNYYIWQPQIVIYEDTTTGHEVWVWSQTDNVNTFRSGVEYGMQPWSADGKRVAFVQEKTVGNYTSSAGYPWFVARSDGSYWRPLSESPNRTDVRRPYFDWSPTQSDTAYTVGYNNNGVTGLDENAIYKQTVTDTGGSYSIHVDLIGGDTTTERAGGIKSAFTGDGKYYMASMWAEQEPFYIAEITGTPQLKLTYNMPALDTYWGNTPADTGDLHDEFFAGNSAHGYWFYFVYTTTSWWRVRPWGTDDGPPTLTTDTSDPYDWWEGTDAQKEIQFINGRDGTLPNNIGPYWSHGAIDPWGTRAIYSDTESDPSPYGPSIWDMEAESSPAHDESEGGVQYSVWNAYADYGVSTVGSTPNKIGILSLDDDYETIFDSHSATTNEFTKPGQSPDGTKVSMRSDWLNSGSGTADWFVGVAYYPYPPEIISVASGVVRFDWRTDQTTSRGYTQRGWPDEDTDDPPPPRETEKFRLWKQASCSGDWSPVTTVNANIFSKYDFADGTWIGNKYWDVTDPSPSGSDCYSVSAVEWSGLESRVKSNVFSDATDSQTVAYPSAPGDDTGITSSYDADIVRFYNIYAEDGSSPTISQTNRITSIPIASDEEWVDWLGNTSGTTQYVVTAVDTQGNESTSLTSSSTHKESPATADGQYTITWDSEEPISSSGGGTFSGTGSFAMQQ